MKQSRRTSIEPSQRDCFAALAMTLVVLAMTQHKSQVE
jgi:hypothetical protein